MVTEARTPCAVPFCSRSRKGTWAWWLCKDHYSAGTALQRRRHAKLKAYFRRRGQIEQTRTAWWPTSEEATRVMDAAGRAIIRAACRRAAGL